MQTIARMALALALPLAALAAPAAAEGDAPAIRHEVAIELDPGTGRISIEDRITGLADVFTFEPAPWLRIAEARLDGSVLAPRDGSRITVPAGGGRALTLLLEGAVPGPSGRPGAAMAGPEGAYLFSNAGWLPDPGAGIARYDVTIRVPAPHRAVMTGRLLSEERADAGHVAHFVFDGRGEAPSIFAGPYRVAERMRGGLRLRTYLHAEVAELSADYLDAAAAHIARFADFIGDYPYEGFSVVSAPVPVGLGFDALTYVSRRILPHPYMRGRSLAHEVLHGWWGNAVAIDHDSGNWAEGLTTYMADHALAEEAGTEAAREMRLEWLRNLSSLPPGRQRPVTAFRVKTHDAAQVLGYDKVAFVFHMLKRELGEAAFREGIRRFWQDRRFRRAGWADLRAAFEAAAGRDLGWFFGQWLDRAGLPRVTLEGAEIRPDGDGFAVSVTLAQSSPPYRLSVPVEIETEAGTERLEIALAGARARATARVAGRPVALAVDPGHAVARRLLPGESPPILRDATLSEETVLVVPPGASLAVRAAAERLASALLHRETRARESADEATARPVLVIGETAPVAALHERVIGPSGTARPRNGTARAWVENGPSGAPWMFVSADDAEALVNRLGRLRHYGRKSFVVYEGEAVAETGLWPARDTPLAARFD